MNDYYSIEEDLEEKMILLNEKDKEILRLKLIIATAIRIYEECAETQDYSTCDLDMYEVLKVVSINE